MRDLDIRKAIRTEIESYYKYDPSTVIIDELGILQGESRIDIAVVNGQLKGYEIKSDRDNLLRLPRQIELYTRVFDYINIVVSERHLHHVLKIVPEWWGIIIASVGKTGMVTLDHYREESKNNKTDIRCIAELLWRNEALNMLARRGADKGFHNKSRSKIWDKLCEVYTTEEIKEAVRLHLKERIHLRAARLLK